MERAERYIVVGMDFSRVSVAAARWIARHVVEDELLVLAHAICIPEPPEFLRSLYPPVEPLRADARRGAELRMRELTPSLGAQRVCPEIREGRPDEVLADVAAAYGADLLVVGPHGDRPGLGRLLGSTAERVARRGATSVLLARGLPDGPLRTVLVAVDESDATGEVLAWAGRLARRSGAAVVGMHVVNPLLAGAVAMGAATKERRRAEDQLGQRAEEWMRRCMSAAKLDHVGIEVAFGHPSFEIMAAADRLEADLVVLGRNAPGRGRTRDIGGTASSVMRSGAGSVLLVARAATTERT